MNANRRKLIEVSLPLSAINNASAYEKLPGIGSHPRGVHHWWARRPLVCCRSVLFGQLVDDPSSWPDYFPTEDKQDTERQRLFRILEELTDWKNSSSLRVLDAARYEIARSAARSAVAEGESSKLEAAILDGRASSSEIETYLHESLPPIHDPFAGGGAIPLEAQRLGLRAVASDLNPVAVLINKALLSVTARFNRASAVNPERADLLAPNQGSQALAEDVRYYGAWMVDEARKQIGHHYQESGVDGDNKVIAWIWARTVESPDPALSGVHVPLVSSFFLANKKGRETYLHPVTFKEDHHWKFEIRTGAPKDKRAIRNGTKIGRGNFRCLLSGTPISADYIRREGQAGRLGKRIIAVVREGKRGRTYEEPTSETQSIADSAAAEDAPQTLLPEKALGFRIQNYGMRSHADHFTSRQLVALTCLSDLVIAARERVFADALASGLEEGGPFEAGGTGARAYSEAISLFLAFVVDRCVDFNNCGAGWRAGNEKIMSLFSRQVIPMTWDFGEANILENVVGGLPAALEYEAKCIETLPGGVEGTVFQGSASTAIQRDVFPIFSTDPPYYDNVAYADLSDFFYIWLRRSLKQCFPSIFRTMLVPKSEELVADPFRHGDPKQAESYFMDGMASVLSGLAKKQDSRFPVTVYYAFKQSETSVSGTSSTGWATFLSAVVGSGFEITGTLPVRSEQSTRWRGLGANALASSVVLVCRHRKTKETAITRGEFRRLLRAELPSLLMALQHGNIAPVDMAQASIGPGMSVFSRHEKVVEADGEAMTVKTALELINEALDEFLSEQTGSLDSDTRFALTWFESHGYEAGPYGEAETLATARNVSVDGVEDAGVLSSAAGKVKLLQRSELPASWDPRTDSRLTVWEGVQHLIKRLDEEGEASAARLLGNLGGLKESIRGLAYQLFLICERRGWADEAGAYNRLIAVWPDLEMMAVAPPAVQGQMLSGEE